ncbi:MAG: hypothetical protein ACRDK2_01720, partial [Solirubrobacteraceae bacterium]
MIALVHLVWGPLGPELPQRFLDSYRRHSAEIEHELVILFNGVDTEARRSFEPLLADTPHETVTLERPVQDLEAYIQAAQRLSHKRLCFMNSYSEILADGWLAKLSAALDRPDVGMAGATGSWTSIFSMLLNALRLPNPYRRTLPSRAEVRRQMYAIESQLGREREGELPGRAAPVGSAPLSFKLASIAKTLRLLPEQLLLFEPFPAQHLRTNAFIVERELFASLRTRPMRRKMDAWVMESGRESFTRQVQRRGLHTLVVDRDGLTYDQEQWPLSRTFWQLNQEGLLVADNQTRAYQLGS